MTTHSRNCDWHVDQYPWECTCGLTVPSQYLARIATMAEHELDYVIPYWWANTARLSGEDVTEADFENAVAARRKHFEDIALLRERPEAGGD